MAKKPSDKIKATGNKFYASPVRNPNPRPSNRAPITDATKPALKKPKVSELWK
jgi:hypothetical protein